MKKEAVIFVVNSLNNGGAERVCANLANEYEKEGFKVFFILVGSCHKKCSYNINKSIDIICMNYDLDKKMSKMKCLFFGWHKLNSIISGIEKEYSIRLVTSHLPMSHIVTRFSKMSRKTIYVLHSTMKTFSSNTSVIFKIILRLFFKKRKLACVSKGIQEESVDIYKFDGRYVRTIYNPVDLDIITKKSKEPIERLKKPYILVVGRLNVLKRHDRAIEIFKEGNFFKKYLLVFCGVGELEDDLRKKIKEKNLCDNVVFLGWQDNVYKWIKNAEVLLCTSDQEGFPMNLIEAFVCNTKVVSSDCDFGPKEIMTGVYSKYLVEKDDISDYIKKINLALKTYPKISNSIIDRCKSSVITKEYLDYYEEKI